MDTVHEDSSLPWNQRPKDSDRRLKDEVFIFVPDCTEAYIVKKTIIIVRAAFSSDCSDLCLPGALLWRRQDRVCWKKAIHFQEVVLLILKVLQIEAVCWLWLSLSVWKLVPLKCLFSLSLVSKGISALKTLMLREYFEEVQTDLEVEASLSVASKYFLSIWSGAIGTFFFFFFYFSETKMALMARCFSKPRLTRRPRQQNVSIFRGMDIRNIVELQSRGEEQQSVCTSHT